MTLSGVDILMHQEFVVFAAIEEKDQKSLQ